jgi:hypothetical protein
VSEAPIPYSVSYSGLVRGEVRRLIAAAPTPQRARAILAAFKELDRLLHVYPQFGEPLLDLQEPGQLRVVTIDPVVIRYAIYEERRLVIVTTPPILLPMSSPGKEAEGH